MSVDPDRQEQRRARLSDDELLGRCDSLLSLIRHREGSRLTEQTRLDLDELLPLLRARTDRATRERWRA